MTDGLEPKKRKPGRPPKSETQLDAAGIDIYAVQERYKIKQEQGSKLTPKLLTNLLDAGNAGMSIAEFCAHNGVSRKSFYKYLEDEDFATAFDCYKMSLQAYYSRLARLSALEGTGVSASGLQVALKFALGFGLKEVHELATLEEVDTTKAMGYAPQQPVAINLTLGGLSLPSKTLTHLEGDRANDTTKNITYNGEAKRIDA